MNFVALCGRNREAKGLVLIAYRSHGYPNFFRSKFSSYTQTLRNGRIGLNLQLHRAAFNYKPAASTIINEFHRLRHFHTTKLQEKSASSIAATSVEDAALKLSAQQKAVLLTLKCIIKIYDIVTLPIYAAVQQPWKALSLHKAKKSLVINKDKHIYGTVVPKSEISLELEQFNVDTLEKAIARAVEKHGNKLCSGTREIISEEEVKDSNGKILKKFHLDDPKWKTFNEINELAEHLSSGFGKLGIKPKENIAIFAETREEWLITAIAAFKRSLPVVTIFTILGNDGVIHAVNETEVSCVVTSEDLMPRCKEIFKNTPSVKNIIYMENLRASSSPSSISIDEIPNIRIQTIQDVISLGAKSYKKDESTRPGPDDTSIIMYTSGSTGVPKGVVLSQYNMLTVLKSLIDTLRFSVGESDESDLYIGYLPIAHVMELIGETFCLLMGVKIGFSSPLTLLDTSPGIKEGTKGDISVFKPSTLPAAPLVLERVSKGIRAKVEQKGPLASALFYYLYNYKAGWEKKGYKTPVLDRLFFRKISAALGGNVRLLTCGGAPLAPHTQEFVRNVLCSPICISYGMTESSGLGAFTQATDMTAGRVGGPIGGSTLFRLVNWEEGGYRVTDKPNPRGEVYIGGENVALGGYYKRADITDFFHEDGISWIKTGDIAELEGDGGFRVIDRKKDLIKLSTGEYVSLGKVEAILKTSVVVENICVVADPFQPFSVAIIVPVQDQVEALGKKLGKSTNFADLCKDPEISEAIFKQVEQHGKLHKLEKYERPQKICLSPEPWMPQSGLVTAALKNQRNNLFKYFELDVKKMYASN